MKELMKGALDINHLNDHLLMHFRWLLHYYFQKTIQDLFALCWLFFILIILFREKVYLTFFIIKLSFITVYLPEKFIWGLKSKVSFKQIAIERRFLIGSGFVRLTGKAIFWLAVVSWLTGEEPDSYGYGGSGKFSTNNKFSNYGERFTRGDVIMALLDFDIRPPKISYAKNGKWLGMASPLHGYKVGSREDALFPHILSKNCR